MKTNKKIKLIYFDLLKKYGKQGWWPLIKYDYINKQYYSYYHVNEYPNYNLDEIFEISLGAILTQNTSWKNVEKALINLKINKILDYRKILDNIDLLKECIKPVGYYNQKTKKIIYFVEFFNTKKIEINKIQRNELLDIWGIGKETADSILLYALNKKVFVIDAYTKRLLNYYKIDFDNDYDEIQKMFHNALNNFDYKQYQEYHALIVRFGKELKNKKTKML